MDGNMDKPPLNKTLQLQKMKAEIIKAGEEMVSRGLVVGTWGNISWRLPEGDQILITPSGINYNSVKPTDMVVVDLNGEIIDGERKPTTETILHTAVYQARPDVVAVVHTHSNFASVMAVARVPIPPILEDMAQIIGGQVEVAPYALAGTQELADNTVAALGNRNAVLMANHVVLGVGRSLNEAFKACQIVEKSAQIFLYAGLVGHPHVLDQKDVHFLRDYYLHKYGQY